MYNDVIKAMSGARTLSEHISKLQNILDKSSTVDPQLIAAINLIISNLMDGQLIAIKKKEASQKVRLSDSSSDLFQKVYIYCQNKAKSGEPGWMNAARNACWTPPQ
ncbi:hypothetical protein C7424_3877 [Pantoea ananatis]|nr:hypothetical protein C7424_3877 [Pantoea ananatis]